MRCIHKLRMWSYVSYHNDDDNVIEFHTIEKNTCMYIYPGLPMLNILCILLVLNQQM